VQGSYDSPLSPLSLFRAPFPAFYGLRIRSVQCVPRLYERFLIQQKAQAEGAGVVTHFLSNSTNVAKYQNFFVHCLFATCFSLSLARLSLHCVSLPTFVRFAHILRFVLPLL
jgi:hypothetical protein